MLPEPVFLGRVQPSRELCSDGRSLSVLPPPVSPPRTAWVQKIKAASELYIETEKKKREKAYLGEALPPAGPGGRGALRARVRLGVRGALRAEGVPAGGGSGGGGRALRRWRWGRRGVGCRMGSGRRGEPDAELKARRRVPEGQVPEAGGGRAERGPRLMKRLGCFSASQSVHRGRRGSGG